MKKLKIDEKDKPYLHWYISLLLFFLIPVAPVVIVPAIVFVLIYGIFFRDKSESSAATPATSITTTTVETRLNELNNLRAKGLITEEDYNKKKEEILSDI
jgi:uncharacterized membrane protein